MSEGKRRSVKVATSVFDFELQRLIIRASRGSLLYSFGAAVVDSFKLRLPTDIHLFTVFDNINNGTITSSRIPIH